jgi:hypothetical protein
MPKLDMLSWLNQVLTTTVVMFFFYALLALVFLSNISSMFKGRTKSNKELYIGIKSNKLCVLLLLLTFFFFGVDNFEGLYSPLSFYPSIVLLSGKGSSSSLSPKAAVKKSSTGAQDAPNDGNAYPVDNDHAWPVEETDLWDLLPPSVGTSSTVGSLIIKKVKENTTNGSEFQAHELSTGPTDTTSVGYYGKGPLNGLLELCGYTNAKEANAVFAAKTQVLNANCMEAERLAYLAGEKAGEAAALAKMTVAYAVYNSVVCIFLGKMLLLFLLTLVFDFILSEIEYNYFYKDKKQS